jgi:hypothetical protein
MLVAAPAAAAPPAHDLARARTLDKEGARAYSEGRYADAIRDFEEAYRLGGPAFELWNVAKCHIRLDQPEQAAAMLEKYLATPNLPKEDRDDANTQLETLKKRPSTLVVSSTPPGATVTLDGKVLDGKTPLSMTVPPGTHTVVITSSSAAPYTKQVEARYGQRIAVDAAAPPPAESRPPPPPNPYEVKEGQPLALRAALGISLPLHGGVGGNVGLAFTALGTYRLVELPNESARARGEEGLTLSVGALLSILGDSWGDHTNGNAAQPANCAAPLHNPNGATALSLFGIGSASFPILPHLRGTALAGLGAAGYFIGDVGGDVFIPSCNTSPGVRPALLVGSELDYAVTSSVRLSAFPLSWQFQPAFAGTRASPHDASSPWMRFGIGVGAGVDL